jgi:hypothetical protein
MRCACARTRTNSSCITTYKSSIQNHAERPPDGGAFFGEIFKKGPDLLKKKAVNNS